MNRAQGSVGAVPGTVRSGNGSPHGDARNDHRVHRKPPRGSWIFDADKADLISILDGLPVGVAVLRNTFGNVLYINQKVVDTLGYELSDTPSTRIMFHKAVPDRKARRETNKSWSEASQNLPEAFSRHFL